LLLRVEPKLELEEINCHLAKNKTSFKVDNIDKIKNVMKKTTSKTVNLMKSTTS
jgi:hypothetical protein